MEFLKQEQIDAARASMAGVELHEVQWQGGTVALFKLPASINYKLFRKNASQGPEMQYDAELALAKHCIVAPDAAAVAGMFEKYPGLSETIAARIVVACGYDQNVTAKKL